MGRTLAQMMAALPQAEREKIEARALELIQKELSLRELRHAHGLTQARLARNLSIGQGAVARLEGRADMFVSTLRGYVEQMGGSLELVARFPDRPPVRLKGLGELSAREGHQRSARRAKPRRAAA